MTASEAGYDELSPDRRVLVRWRYDHGLGNVEYEVPSFFDADTMEPLFDLGGDYEGGVTWLEGGCFRLDLGTPWGGGQAHLLVDPAAGTYRACARAEEGETEDGPEEPFARMAAGVAAELDRGREERERLGVERARLLQQESWTQEWRRRVRGTLIILAVGAAALTYVLVTMS